MELSFGKLRAASGSPSPIFLSLLDPRITGYETGFLQDIFQVEIVLKKGLRNTVSDGNGLTGDTPSMDIDGHIELIPGSSEFKGLKSNHFTGLSPKVFLDRSLINDNLPFARFKPYPCDGCLSLACCINRFCHGFS